MALQASQRYKDAIRAGHKIAVRVEIWGTTGLIHRWERTPTQPNEPYIYGGEVQITGQEYPKRSARVTLIDPQGDLIARSTSTTYWYGRIMKVFRGVVFDHPHGFFTEVPFEQDVEYVQIAQLSVDQVRISFNNYTKTITIRGRDLSYGPQRARFTSSYKVAAGTNAGVAIRDILTSVGVPASIMNFEPTTATVGELNYQMGEDPWDACQDIAKGVGKYLAYDTQGQVVFRQKPDPGYAGVSWVYDASRYNPEDRTTGFPLLDVDREHTDEDLYNHVIVTGENTDSVVRAEAKDTDPNSPTRYDGPFGRSTYFETVSATTTQADAQARANDILSRVRLSTELLTIRTIPNPLMEVGDVLFVREDNSRTRNAYTAQELMIPFERSAEQTIRMHRQKV